MATIYLSLSTRIDATKKQEILIRFSHGRINQRAKTNIFISAEYIDESGKRKPIWNDMNQQIVIPNFRLMTDEKKELKQSLTGQSEKLNTLVAFIQKAFNDIENKSTISSDWLKDCIDRYYQRGKYAPVVEMFEKKQSFFDLFTEFLEKHKLSDVREKNFKVVIRALKRYELYVQLTRDKSFSLDLDHATPDILDDFEVFLKNEYLLCPQYPSLYEAVPESRTPQPRGQNTINGIFTKMRTFFIWAVENGKTENNPFRKYSIEECVYGTPYYIGIEERNQLYHTDLSHRPALETQRDIFVFQCLTGLRVSDLYKLTKQNVIQGAVEYIAGKTKDDRPVTVRVPLNSIAEEILAKYAGYEGKTLFPYISEQKYNQDIKKIFAAAGLTRPVVILDPLTRKSVIRPLNEIASSHMARRTFIGNLYKQVKDPNLVGALSGHKEGSKAFARYREIDEDMKKELVKMLE
ncbi:MAG: site-specific integrase [Candidatus Azobacteroides sp.]|nr:site-specific integrase [Candidatus Azobacteroides sp.]